MQALTPQQKSFRLCGLICPLICSCQSVVFMQDRSMGETPDKLAMRVAYVDRTG